MIETDFVSAFYVWLIIFGPLIAWALVSTHRDSKKYDVVEFGGRMFKRRKP